MRNNQILQTVLPHNGTGQVIDTGVRFVNLCIGGGLQHAGHLMREDGEISGRSDHVEVAFVDNGQGMTDDVKRRAFDPFFTTARGRGGTGLGLHIVHNIVTNQLGGRIAIASEPGRGVRFRIVLPTNAPQFAAQETPHEAKA